MYAPVYICHNTFIRPTPPSTIPPSSFATEQNQDEFEDDEFEDDEFEDDEVCLIECTRCLYSCNDIIVYL